MFLTELETMNHSDRSVTSPTEENASKVEILMRSTLNSEKDWVINEHSSADQDCQTENKKIVLLFRHKKSLLLLSKLPNLK